MTGVRRGQFVTLTIGSWSSPAMVGFASENGRSLMLLFDGIAPVAGGGGVVGALPVLQQDDGSWIEIVTSSPVAVALQEN